MSAQVHANTIVVQHRIDQGVVAGLLSCVLGILGIFFWGILFVPLAAVCSFVGLIRGIIGASMAGIGCSLLGGILAAFGFVTSPSLWILLGASMLAHQPAPARPPVPVPSIVAAPPSNAEAIRQASITANAAMAECVNRRRSGELKTHLASVNCSNPRIVAAYQGAAYRYMDLVYQLTGKRRELAEGLDNGTLTEQQAQIEFAQFMTRITEEEHRRDVVQR